MPVAAVVLGITTMYYQLAVLVEGPQAVTAMLATTFTALVLEALNLPAAHPVRLKRELCSLLALLVSVQTATVGRGGAALVVAVTTVVDLVCMAAAVARGTSAA